MIKERKNFFMNCILGIAVFIMLFISLFFYQVHIDNYIFYTFTDFNFSSIANYCLHYGNGRFLGNFICAVMSHLFCASPFFVSASLLAIFLLLNKFIFESNYKTLLIIFIAFFSLEFLATERIYDCLPMFINYVLPFLFFLLSLQFFATFKKSNGIVKAACSILMCLFAFSSALFSENTSLVFVLCILIYCFWLYKNKKLSLIDVSLLGFTLLGLVTMFLLPHFFGVADLLKWYRGTVDFTVKSLIIQSAQLSKYIAEFPLLLTTISFAEFIYLFFVSDKKVNISIYLIISAIPLLTFIMIEKSSMDNILVRLVALCILALYVLAVIWALFKYTQKKHRPVFWGLAILVASNIGMCLFVEPIGIRVLFASYFFAIVWLLYSVKVASPQIRARVKLSSKALIFVLVVISAVFSSFTFLENVDLFVRQIYDLADDSVKQNVNLEDSGVNISKYIFAFKSRELSHPEYMKVVFETDELFLEHIDSFDH